MSFGTQVSNARNPDTQRSRGENYVADCTQPDDVEPARRRLIQPVGSGLASPQCRQNSSGSGARGCLIT